MNGPSALPLRIGDWFVDPQSGRISRSGEAVRLEARTMRLLLCLAERAGEIVSIDELLDRVWTGVIVTPDSVYQAITSLRRLLGDDPKQPAYIATVPRLGYRLVAAVSPWVEQVPQAQDGEPAMLSRTDGESAAPSSNTATARPTRYVFQIGAILLLLLAGAAVYRFAGRDTLQSLATMQASAQQNNSIGVLPFLDLTSQAMNEEYFADGMTEELIDHLSKVPGFQVPGATSSFYFKDKDLPVAEIAQKLGVTYLLDGSVRKSDATLRVAARLVRASDGYVVWTETYDRPLGDILIIQKNIAAEVATAVHGTLDK
jgi:transcriptional activator of cad operon